MSIPAFTVSRSRSMHRWVLIISLLVVVGLASVPFWSTVAVCRTMVTFFTLLALAQMWNLLGGYAGLSPSASRPTSASAPTVCGSSATFSA
jgi:branched-chain amino acid transport system permease protein